jgi:hypothetical protein
MRKVIVGGCVLAAGLVSAPALHADARGKVSVSGVSFAVVDAVAYKNDDGVAVTLLPAPFDLKAAAKDRKIDTFDFMRMGGAYITLKVDADGSFNCIDFSTGQGGGSSCDNSFTPALKLTTRTAERIAGTFRLKSKSDNADVTFDLKVESTLTPPGTALPPDGGEPGRAVLAHFAAIEKNDFKALMATAAPEQRAMMAASEKSGEAKKLFEMMRAMSPRKVRVTGGTVDGESALVEFEGVEDGKPIKGTADVERIAGKWYMSGSSTR